MDKNKSKHVWHNATLKEFMGAGLTELRKGNGSGTRFNKVGWANIERALKEKTGKVFDKKQLKNKWYIMKKDWELYDRLVSLEGGSDGARRLMDASPEWWEEKIKVDKEFAKFRDVNLDIYETHYAPLFRDSIVVLEQNVAPLQVQNHGDQNVVQLEKNIEGKGDGDDDDEIDIGVDEPCFPNNFESTPSKRKKCKDVVNNRSTKGKTSSFEEQLDVVLDSLSTESTPMFPPNNPSPRISDCMNIVITFPGFNEGSRKYLQALRVFIKKEIREAFMYPTTHEAKMEFLKLVMKE